MKSYHARVKPVVFVFFQCIIATMLFAQAPATSSQQNESVAKFPPTTDSKLTYKIIDALNHTFCYDVYADGKLMIHQTSISAMPGNEGFKKNQMLLKLHYS